eukprot:g22006.t1
MPQFSWKLVFAALILLAAVGDRSKIEAQNAANQPGAAGGAGAQGAKEESPLLIEPKTPDEFFKAAILMHRLARPNLARGYLQKLMDTNPDDAALLKLRDAHGPAPFLRLSNSKALRPLSSELLKRVNAAFRKRGADPKYIDQVLNSLNGTAYDRRIAIITLQNTGEIVVPRILERIMESTSAAQSARLQEALTEIGSDAVPPLLAALDSPDDRIRMTAITALGLIRSPEAAPYLWYYAFDKTVLKGVRLSARQALARIYGTSQMAVDSTAPASIVNELKRNAIKHFRHEHRWEAASLYVGTRFAKQALALSSENRDSQALFLAMSLAASADPKWEKPLPTGPGTPHDASLAAGSEVVNEALRLATKHENPTAAVASLIVLRQIAGKSDLGRKSPIITALNNPNARVRFAAAGTVMHIDPDRKFAGSSRVVSILARSLTNDGAAKGLVVNTSQQKGATIAGLLGEMGYEPYVSQTGREGFRTAAERSDIDLILLQLNTIRWPLSQTIANLRADARTSQIPIAIYGPQAMRHRVISQLNKYPRLTYIVDSSTSLGLSTQLTPFLTSLQGEPLNNKQRQAQREAAVYWLAQIASGHRGKVFDLKPAEKSLVSAVYDPTLTANATLALSAIPTKSAQETIHSVAVADRIDVKLREAAALQLAYHIQKFGLLLSARKVDALKQSLAGTSDAGLATALTAVMGSLKPNSKRVGDRLRNFPLPTVPKGP